MSTITLFDEKYIMAAHNWTMREKAIGKSRAKREEEQLYIEIMK